MGISKSTKQLRKEIPSFKCGQCGECCGPVPFNEWERTRVPDKKFKGEHCQFLKNNKCEIYPERPIICRLFGTIQELQCPKGYRPKTLLTSEKKINIIIRYLETIDLSKFTPGNLFSIEEFMNKLFE